MNRADAEGNRGSGTVRISAVQTFNGQGTGAVLGPSACAYGPQLKVGSLRLMCLRSGTARAGGDSETQFVAKSVGEQWILETEARFAKPCRVRAGAGKQ